MTDYLAPPGWTTVGDIRRMQRGESPSLDRNARLFKDRDILGISTLVRSNPREARRAAAAAGENPDVWFPSNPL